MNQIETVSGANEAAERATESGSERVNLLGLTRPELEAFCATLGSRPFRGRQLMSWLYKRGCDRFEQMSDLARDFRAQLAERAEVRLPEIITVQRASDGTCKWLLAAGGAQAFEMVYIPEADRGTLCISSQVGCVLDCAFCSTAQQGFNRNLSTAEMVGQVWLANRELGFKPGAERIITNVVLMGMGEPLANFRNVVAALQVLLDDLGFDLSRRRVTLSTAGLVPQIYRLARCANVALAVSLHAPEDALRSELVPINRIHPIEQLLQACWHYIDEQNGRSVTFEYVMLEGINDAPSQARALARLLSGHPAKVNLIPFNPFPGTRFRRSSDAAIVRFRDELNDAGIIATIRRPRGLDIDAACGQLVGRVHDRTVVRLGRKMAAAQAAAIAVLGLAAAGCVTTTTTTTNTMSPSNVPSNASKAAGKADASRINVQLGVDYLRQGDLQIAQQKLQRALDEDPDNPDAHGAMALLDERLGKPKDADQEYRRAIILSHRAPAILNSYGVYLCSHGHADEGLRDFAEAAGNPLYPTPWAAYTNAGVCLHGVHRDAEATAQFDRALQSNPSFAEAALRASDLDFSLHRYSEARLRIELYLLSYRATPDLLLLGWRIAAAQADGGAQARFAARLTQEFPDSAQAHALAFPAAGRGT